MSAEKQETTSPEGEPTAVVPAAGRRAYRTPVLTSRPLFERMALGCADPGAGDPY